MTVTLVRVDPKAEKLDVETARDFLSRCLHADEAKGLRDKAAGVARYLRERGASLEAQQDALEIFIRAERRLGELLKETEKAKGTRLHGRDSLGGTKKEPPKTDVPTLADQGITKKQSSRWQALAAVPEKRFEDIVKEKREKAEKLTASSVLAVARPKGPAKVKAKTAQPDDAVVDDDDAEGAADDDEWNDIVESIEISNAIQRAWSKWDGSAPREEIIRKLQYWLSRFTKGKVDRVKIA